MRGWWDFVRFFFWKDTPPSNQITPNFNIREFDCKNGVPYPDLWRPRLRILCRQLEVIRTYFGDKKITITSGYRPAKYNKKVGGVLKSQHIVGRAADIKIEGVSARKVAKGIRELMKADLIIKGGLGSYSTWTHIDTRGNMTYWRV